MALYEPSEQYAFGEGPSLSRNVLKWIAGFALAVVFALTLFALQFFLLSSEGASERALRRAVDALAEGDAVIARGYDDLQDRAEAAESDETVELEDYPVNVPLSRDEALGASPEELRDLLTRRSASTLYDDGTSALRHEEADGSAGRFTSAGVVDEVLGWMHDDVHMLSGIVTAVLAVICAVLALALVALCRGFGRVVAVGLSVLAGSLPLLAAGTVALIYANISLDPDTEYVRAELLEIGQDLAMLPVRTGLTFAALGLALVLVGIVGARLSRSEHRRLAYAPRR